MKDTYTKNEIYLAFIKDELEFLELLDLPTESYICDGRELAHDFMVTLDSL